MKPPKKHLAGGFTLLELIFAGSIFSVVSYSFLLVPRRCFSVMWFFTR